MSRPAPAPSGTQHRPDSRTQPRTESEPTSTRRAGSGHEGAVGRVSVYVGATMHEALGRVKRELGAQAVILRTRVVESGSWPHVRKSFEITAGVSAGVSAGAAAMASVNVATTAKAAAESREARFVATGFRSVATPHAEPSPEPAASATMIDVGLEGDAQWARMLREELESVRAAVRAMRAATHASAEGDQRSQVQESHDVACDDRGTIQAGGRLRLAA